VGALKPLGKSVNFYVQVQKEGYFRRETKSIFYFKVKIKQMLSEKNIISILNLSEYIIQAELTSPALAYT